MADANCLPQEHSHTELSREEEEQQHQQQKDALRQQPIDRKSDTNSNTNENGKDSGTGYVCGDDNRPESPDSALDANLEESDEEAAAADEIVRESVSLDVVWKGSERYQLKIPKYATVLSVKALIEELTDIEADSQKLLGLVKGRLPKDKDTLADLGVRSGTKVVLVGTRRADKLAVSKRVSWLEQDGSFTGISPDVDDPEDPAGSGGYPGVRPSGSGRSRVVSDEWKRGLANLISSSEVRIMNQPRAGKKLVVLDLDYTLFDCKNVSGNVADMVRPGLHEFLSAIYPHYDLIVWSQTRWHVVESKITLLGMLTHPLYRITAALDISTMLTVKAIRNGQHTQHQVKPLEFIWARFPEHYSSHNTIHIDDLSRNFALNYQNGLKIRAFKRADMQLRNDTELFKLARYLMKIASLSSFKHLDHSKWNSYRW
ncbi:hypothetical protein GGI07_002756 [Coemansia sp. Benny D115]|nr:hypothetical protein GGI07_002756 [Coemansia sp. Benny D115]